MTERRRIFLLIVIMAVVAVGVAGTTLFVLYQAALDQQRERLVETAHSQARLIEAMAQFDAQYSAEDVPGGAFEATLSQVRSAHEQFKGFGETGEFTLAKLEGDQIVFLLRHRHYDMDNPEPVPFSGELAEPMRRALSGSSGTVVGLDYRGELVLAAYEPVEGLDLGIVAKIDLAEVRAPFVRAGAYAISTAAVIVLLGAVLFLRVTNPLLRDLEENQALLTQVLETLPIGVWMSDGEGNIMYGNPAGQRIWAGAKYVGPEEFGEYKAWWLDSGEPLEADDWAVARAVSKGETSLNEELKIECFDGTSRIILNSAVPIRNAQGEITGVVALNQDISESKKAEDNLQWQLSVNAALSALYEPVISPSASIEEITTAILGQARNLTGSAHGYVSSIDPATGDSVSHTLTEMLKNQCGVTGQDRRIVFPRGDDGRYPGLWGLALNTCEAFFTNSPQTHPASTGVPDGHIPLQRFLSVPVRLGDELVGQITLANPSRDYTERDLDAIRRLGEFYALAIQRQRAERALVAARKEAEEANELKTKFLATISHELRTPLASIKGFATTLLADDVTWDPESQHDFLETIDQEADKLTELIEQLLDLSRLEAGELRITLRKLYFDEILSLALAQLKTLTVAHDLRLSIPEDLPPVNADPSRIAQVLANLTTNAVKYSPPRTEVLIAASVQKGRVQVDVTDQGPGIPLEERERIFEAFQRGNAVSTGPSGAGLGLAICKGIIEAHGGRIWIQRRPGAGTTFSFTLPIA
jgi:PAS domain S-box-containing protein